MPGANQSDVEQLRRELSQLTKQVESLTASVDGLVTAWKMAGHMVAFTKWAAGIATAIIALWMAITKMKV